MKVRELIEKLKTCHPDAEVCAEVWMNPAINEVKEYEIDGRSCVYISDCLESFEYECGIFDEDDYIPSAENGDYSPSNPWDAPGMSISDFI